MHTTSLTLQAVTRARFALCGLLWLTPLVAHAEEQDLGEVVHAIFIVGIFGTLFLAGLSLGIWLLVVRLRDKDRNAAGQSGATVRPNLENIWFPSATAVTVPPSQPPSENP